MKTLITAMALCATAALLPLQAQDTVTSVNAVGMVRISIQPGELQLIQPTFIGENETPLIGEVLGEMPNGTTVYVWDAAPSAQVYITEQYSEGFGWFPGTTQIARNQGFFVLLPNTAPETSIVLSGEVPGGEVNETFMTEIVPGLQMIGFPFPTSTPLSETNLSVPPSSGGIVSNGDSIYAWTGNGWSTEQYFEGFGWFPGTLIFQPGQAYFYLTTTGKSWNEVKPYVWP